VIYSSTSCLKNPSNLIHVLKEYEVGGVNNVELGSVHAFFDVNEIKKFHFNFLIHNYFPPPKIPFIFNLASLNKLIRKKSIHLAKKAIDLANKIDCPLYTFHAGFTVNPNKLGKPFPKNQNVDRKKSIIKIIIHQ